MTAKHWIRITGVENVPPREGRSVQLGSVEVALFNTGDRFLAIENRCPHGGGPLADGIVGGSTVTCPLHNWRICLESGYVTKPCQPGADSGPARTFETKVQDGVVLLALDTEISVAA
jgi:nitrite reductase (NADH) small subunit